MTISMHLHGSSAIIAQISIKSDLCGLDCKDKRQNLGHHIVAFVFCAALPPF